MKLSDKQKEVVIDLRKGSTISQSPLGEYRMFTSNYYFIGYIHKGTMKSLITKGLITDNEYPIEYCPLTELGKTIEL